MSCMRLAACLVLFAFSGALLRLVPEREASLAELTPEGSLLFFEASPGSMLSSWPETRLAGPVAGDPAWLRDSIRGLTEADWRLARRLAEDPLTRVSISVFDLKSVMPEEVKVDFLLLAWTSRDNFANLVELGVRAIRRAVPPGYYIELQREPRLGVMVGQPPRRLYVYEDDPVFLISNSRELVLRVLEIRYKGQPALVQQADFRRMQRAVPISYGATLYLTVGGLLARSEFSAIPFLSLVQALDFPDLPVVVYRWDNIRGQIVRRLMLQRRS